MNSGKSFIYKLNRIGIWNLRVQKNLNIEKIIFKVVQMKFLAMHINNQKLSWYIYGKKITEYLYLYLIS